MEAEKKAHGELRSPRICGQQAGELAEPVV